MPTAPTDLPTIRRKLAESENSQPRRAAWCINYGKMLLDEIERLTKAKEEPMEAEQLTEMTPDEGAAYQAALAGGPTLKHEGKALPGGRRPVVNKSLCGDRWYVSRHNPQEWLWKGEWHSDVRPGPVWGYYDSKESATAALAEWNKQQQASAERPLSVGVSSADSSRSESVDGSLPTPPTETPDRTWGAALAQGIRDQAAVIDERDQWKARAEAAEAKLAAPPPAMPRTITRDGDTGAVYVRFGDGDVAQTTELIEGVVFVDVGADGRWIGAEILCAPRDQTAIERQVAEVTRERDEAKSLLESAHVTLGQYVNGIMRAGIPYGTSLEMEDAVCKVISERDTARRELAECQAALAAERAVAMPTREELCEWAFNSQVMLRDDPVGAVYDRLLPYFRDPTTKERELNADIGGLERALEQCRRERDEQLANLSKELTAELDYSRQLIAREANALAQLKAVVAERDTARRELSECRKELAEFQGDNLSRCCACRFDDGKLTTECHYHKCEREKLSECQSALTAERAGAGAMKDELRKWIVARNSLSSDCRELGINSSAVDSGRWGQELARRCEPLRNWCEQHLLREPPTAGQSLIDQHVAEVAGLKAEIERLQHAANAADAILESAIESTAQRDAAERAWAIYIENMFNDDGWYMEKDGSAGWWVNNKEGDQLASGHASPQAALLAADTAARKEMTNG